MSTALGPFSPTRATAALTATLAAGSLTGLALVRTARAPAGPGLPGLAHHVQVVALASLTACAGWAAVTLVVLVWEHRGGTAPRRAQVGRLCPDRCRRALLVLCSAGVTVSVVPPATATPRGLGDPPSLHAPLHAVHALPTLERPLTRTGTPGVHVVVAAGDSLWSLARRSHPDEAASDTARRVSALYRANIAVIGDDPDLIRPGQVLRIPGPDPSPR